MDKGILSTLLSAYAAMHRKWASKLTSTRLYAIRDNITIAGSPLPANNSANDYVCIANIMMPISVNTYHYYDRRLLHVLADQSDPNEDAEQRIRHQGGQVAGICQRLYDGHGAHGPVTAQVARKEQQPQVERCQVVVGELAVRRRRHRSRIIESRTTEHDNITLFSGAHVTHTRRLHH